MQTKSTFIAVLVGSGGELDRIEFQAAEGWTLRALCHALKQRDGKAWTMAEGDAIRIRTPENINTEV